VYVSLFLLIFLSGWYDIPDYCRPALQRMHFDDVDDISQEEMTSLCFNLMNDLNFDGEVPLFYVYRLDKDDQYKLISSILFILYLVHHMLHYALSDLIIKYVFEPHRR
jgi:hypothetical protein